MFMTTMSEIVTATFRLNEVRIMILNHKVTFTTTITYPTLLLAQPSISLGYCYVMLPALLWGVSSVPFPF